MDHTINFNFVSQFTQIVLISAGIAGNAEQYVRRCLLIVELTKMRGLWSCNLIIRSIDILHWDPKASSVLTLRQRNGIGLLNRR